MWRALSCLLDAARSTRKLSTQVVVRKSNESFSVGLGELFGNASARLKGFKMRALQAEAPTQRHTYVTEWLEVSVEPMTALPSREHGKIVK